MWDLMRFKFGSSGMKFSLEISMVSSRSFYDGSPYPEMTQETLSFWVQDLLHNTCIPACPFEVFFEIWDLKQLMSIDGSQ